MSDFATKFLELIQNISKEYYNNYTPFVESIPTAFLIIPLILFFLSPTLSRGVFLFGVIFTSIIGAIFTPVGAPNNFLNNKPSFHGMALGYLIGYLLMENIVSSKLGSMASTLIMGMILCILLIISILTNPLPRDILHIGIGCILGIILGMLFCYGEYEAQQNLNQKHNS